MQHTKGLLSVMAADLFFIHMQDKKRIQLFPALYLEGGKSYERLR